MPGDPSVRLDSGALPKEPFFIRAFDLMDFVLSPFANSETTSKEAMEEWARSFHQVATDAVEADEDPDRPKKSGSRPGGASAYLSSISETSMGEKSANSSGSGCG